MGMLGNGSRLTFGTGRAMGGLYSTTSGGVRNKGEWDAWCFQDKATTFLAGAAYPTGYNGQSAFYNPMIAGEISMRFDGEGGLEADLYPSKSMAVDFTGAGDMTAVAGLIISMLLSTGGTGSLSAALVGNLDMSADFTGSGDFDANISGIASLLCDLTGEGTLEAVIAAYGDMSIDIVTSGSGLSVGAIVDGVWNALAASYDMSGTMGELLNTAGSGGLPPELVQKIEEVWQLMGLDSGNPLSVSTTERLTGAIAQAIEESGGVVTVTRA